MNEKREFKILLSPEVFADATKFADVQTALCGAFEVFAVGFLGKTAEEAAELAASATALGFDGEPAKKRESGFYLPLAAPFAVRCRTLADGRVQLSLMLRQTRTVTDKQVRFFSEMVGPLAEAQGLKARLEADVFGREMAVGFGVSKFVEGAVPPTLTLRAAIGLLFGDVDAPKVIGFMERLCIAKAEALDVEMRLHAPISETKFKGVVVEALQLTRPEPDVNFHSRFFVTQWKNEEDLIAVELSFKVDLRVGSISLGKKLFDFLNIVDLLQPFLFSGRPTCKTVIYAEKMDGKLPPEAPPAEGEAPPPEAAPAAEGEAPPPEAAPAAEGEAPPPEAAPAAEGEGSK